MNSGNRPMRPVGPPRIPRRLGLLLAVLLAGAGLAWSIDLSGAWRRMNGHRMLENFQAREYLQLQSFASGRLPRDWADGRLMVRALLQLNRTIDALGVIAQFSAPDPPAELDAYRDMALAQRGDLNAAERLTSTHAERSLPREAYEALIRCAEYHGDWNQVEAILTHPPDMVGVPALVDYHRGRVAELQEDYAAAVAHYVAAVRSAPAWARAAFRAAKCSMHEGEFAVSVELLEPLLTGPYQRVVAIELAVCHWELDHPQLGLDILSRVLGEDPHQCIADYLELDEYCDSDRAALVAARCYDALDQSQQAIDLSIRVLEFNPRNFEARNLMIKHLRREGRLDEAQQVAEVQQAMIANRQRCQQLRDAIARQPENLELRLELARLYYETESVAEARLALLEILQIAPEYGPAKELLMRWEAEESGVSAVR